MSSYHRVHDDRRPAGERPAADRPAADRPTADRPAAGGPTTTAAGPARAPNPLWDRALRGLSGVLAGGLVVLSLGLLVVWLLADRWGVPGPGGGTVAGHLAGAVGAVVGQRIADRRPGRVGTLAALAVVATAVLVLGLAWFP